MATYRDVIGGLVIFANYAPKGGPEAHEICAEHDEIFAGSVHPDKLTEEERKALADLGWTYDESLPSWRRYV